MFSLALKIPPPAIAALSIAVMVFTRQWVPLFGFPTSLQWLLSGLLLCCSAAIALLAVFQVRRAGTTLNPHHPHKSTQLVTTGIYRVTRNPMYLGLLIFIAAAGVYLQHSGVIFVVLCSMAYLHWFQILPEEQALAKQFGKTFADYCQQVSRWF